MKKILFMGGCILSISFSLKAQKVAVGKYQTKDTTDKVFITLLKDIPLMKFTVRSSDKTQGTIQATEIASGREFATLFIYYHKQNDSTAIEATFTRSSGFMGGGKPEDWAKKFGEQLKSDFSDLTFDVTKK